jgi:DNA-binding HxlR family transcriptional regulator
LQAEAMTTRSQRNLTGSRPDDQPGAEQAPALPHDDARTASGFEQPCPIRDVLDRIGDQWSLLVLQALAGGTLRFNALLREVGDISRQMLSRTLKQLECDGFVSRTLYAEVPPRVDYELTALGRSFLEPMAVLVAWADAHHRAICDARRSYRTTPPELASSVRVAATSR